MTFFSFLSTRVMLVVLLLLLPPFKWHVARGSVFLSPTESSQVKSSQTTVSDPWFHPISLPLSLGLTLQLFQIHWHRIFLLLFQDPLHLRRSLPSSCVGHCNCTQLSRRLNYTAWPPPIGLSVSIGATKKKESPSPDPAQMSRQSTPR